MRSRDKAVRQQCSLALPLPVTVRRAVNPANVWYPFSFVVNLALFQPCSISHLLLTASAVWFGRPVSRHVGLRCDYDAVIQL